MIAVLLYRKLKCEVPSGYVTVIQLVNCQTKAVRLRLRLAYVRLRDVRCLKCEFEARPAEEEEEEDYKSCDMFQVPRNRDEPVMGDSGQLSCGGGWGNCRGGGQFECNHLQRLT